MSPAPQPATPKPSRRGTMTLKEIDEMEAKMMGETDDLVAAMAGVHEDAKGKRGVVGSITCPRCLGVLRYSTAKQNGHVAARCATEGCLSWIE